VEPLRYIFTNKGAEFSVKLSPQYGYVIVHEPRIEKDSKDI
jgi:hypothetical protein